MNNPFKKVIELYFYFSKSDRNAILILCFLILFSVIAIFIVKNIQPKSKYNYTEYEYLLKELEIPANDYGVQKRSLFVFDPNTIDTKTMDSLDIPQFIKRNIINYRKSGGRLSTPQDIKKIYGMNDSIFFLIADYITISENKNSLSKNSKSEIQISGFFDPNTADFNKLNEFGFNRFQANNLIQYRKKEGTFKSKNDLLKIYGIDSAFFNSIEKYISIELINEIKLPNKGLVIAHIELNSADTTELMKLAGIGSVYANRIIKYRNLLGGYYSTSQLLEIYNMPVETFKNIENSISADTLLIKRIHINFAEYADLLRHPYLNKTQVAAILKYRDRNGSFQNISQLETNGLIDSETFQKIRPYLVCR